MGHFLPVSMRRQSRLWLATALLVPALLGMTGTSRAAPAVHRGGTLTFGVDQDVIAWDGAQTSDNGSLWADLNVYDQLVRLTPDAKGLEPLPGFEPWRKIVPLPVAGRVDRCWDVVPAAGVSTVLIRSLMVLPLAAGLFRQS